MTQKFKLGAVIRVSPMWAVLTLAVHLKKTVSFMFTASYESSEIILVAEDSMYMWILLEFSHIWLAKKKNRDI